MQCENREYYIEDPLLPKLFMQSWDVPEVEKVGSVLITHGISEHSECYTHLGEALAKEGWIVYAWDLQGHGRSQGKRGYISDFSLFSQDLKSVIEKVKEDQSKPTANFHLLGHSMGGLITLQTLMSDDPPKVRSAILSNPCLKIAAPVPKIKEAASEFLNQFWPTLTLNNEVRHEWLSRDLEMVKSYGRDPLRHTKISAPLYLGMVAAMEAVNASPDLLKVPCFFQVSGNDQLVSPLATLDFFKELTGPKQLKLYEESYHEVYNDLNKQESIDDLIAYLGEYKS